MLTEADLGGCRPTLLLLTPEIKIGPVYHYGQLIPWKLSILDRAYRVSQKNDSQDLREEVWRYFRLKTPSGWMTMRFFIAIAKGSQWRGSGATGLLRAAQARGTDALNPRPVHPLENLYLRLPFYQLIFFRQ